MGGTGNANDDYDSEELLECEDIDHKKICIWCRQYKPLVPGKQYCTTCKKQCYRECTRCHRPFNNQKYFSDTDGERCNACHKKYMKEREKLQCDYTSKSGKSDQQKMTNYFTSKELAVSDDSSSASDCSDTPPPCKKKTLEAETISSSDEPPKKKPRQKAKKKGDTTDDSDETVLPQPSKKTSVKQATKSKKVSTVPVKKRGRPKTGNRSIDAKIHAVLTDWLALKTDAAKGESSKIGFLPVFFR